MVIEHTNNQIKNRKSFAHWNRKTKYPEFGINNINHTAKNKTIIVKGTEIIVLSLNETDFISLTDITQLVAL